MRLSLSVRGYSMMTSILLSGDARQRQRRATRTWHEAAGIPSWDSPPPRLWYEMPLSGRTTAVVAERARTSGSGCGRGVCRPMRCVHCFAAERDAMRRRARVASRETLRCEHMMAAKSRRCEGPDGALRRLRKPKSATTPSWFRLAFRCVGLVPDGQDGRAARHHW